MRVVILAVALASLLSAEARQSIRTQRAVCAGQPNGTFIADDTSCLQFFVCSNGEAVSQSCEQGSYFESTELYCLPDTNNICPQSESECSEDGVFSPHPTDCSMFYVCYNGSLVEQSCEAGSYFNKTTLACVPDVDNNCPVAECSVEGAFSPNPTECAKFYVCYNGSLVEQSCEAGSYFNKTTLACVPDVDNNCPVAECSVEGAFSPNPTECAKFYVCYNGSLVEQSCEAGSYFNKTTLACVPDVDNNCPVAECSVEGAFSPNPTECAKFYVCYNGLLVEQSCEAGSYFNKTTLACVPDVDNNCPVAECSVEGAFSPNPTECAKFYVCYNGSLVEQSCDAGSYFDKTTLACVPDVNNTCPVVECSVEGAFSPHPTECAMFYVCDNGTLVEQTCGNGSYFDKTNLYCLPDTEHICWPETVPSTCVGGYNEGDLIASSDSCYEYYVCSNGELVEENCGYGNYFENSTKRCEQDTTGDCWLATTPAPEPVPCQCPGGYEEGELIANNKSCYSYFICSQGSLIEQSCGTGNYFDVDSKSCSRDDNGICWPTTTTTSTAAPEPCGCPGGYKEGDLIENSDSCYSFFVCSQGSLIEQSCGTGNYFDVDSKSCSRDDNGVCWPKTTTSTTAAPVACQCPGGYEDGDLIANNESCYSYFICSQGSLIAQSCGTGNYFDVDSKSCSRDDNGVCWPKTTTSTTAAPVPCQCPGGYKDGDLIANNESCYSYFICSQGSLIAQSCGTGNYFDVDSKSCSRDDNGVCWPKTTTSTTAAPVPCQCPGGYKDGDLIANNESCYSYFICSQGSLIAQSCGTGNYFDVDSKSCSRDDNGVCWPKTTTSTISAPMPCQCPGGYEDGDLIANNESCYSYFICSQGSLIAQSCGTGNYFDVDSKSCSRDDNGVCWPTTTSTTTITAPLQCSGGNEEGDTVASDDNCYSYFICIQGEFIEESCGEGNYFDDSSKNCVRDENGTCWRTTSTSTTTEASYTCNGGYEDGEFVPYPDSCYKFYMCYNGELIESNCGEGNYFDTVSKSCVVDTTGICWPISSSTPSATPSTTTEAPCTCPGGYEDGEFVPYPDSCYKYYMCYNGELIENSCGEGNYFDNVSKSCVVDTTGICLPISSSTPSTSPSTTTEAPCTCPGGYEDGEFVPYPDSCYKYYMCYNGELIENSCGEGNYFDNVSKSCVVDTTGICWPISSSTPSTSPSTTTEAPCTCPEGSEEGEFVPYPDSCYKYYMCYNGELIENSCGEGNYFDNVSKSCVVDTTGICWPISSSTPSTSPSTTTEAPCTCPGGYEDGEFVPYPDSCYKYYMCYNGELIENSCGEGNYFDNVSKSCVVDTTGICWPASSSTPSTTPTTTTEAPCTCPGGYEDGEFVPYPDSCYKFYMCYNGELIENSCGEGNYFDNVSKSCVVDTTGICWPISSSTPSTSPSTTTEAPCTCPGGYEDGEFVPYPDSCYKYYMCYNGELIENSCGEGNYFDNVSKSCVVDTTGICWPISSSTPSTTPTTTTEAPCTCPGGYEDGEFVPYPDSCYKFYMCYNGELIQNSCGEGNYFDNVSKSCVVDTTGICWPASSSTPSTTPSTTTEAPCTCPGGYEDGEFVPYPDSCYKFYVCYNGELIENSCGEGNYFDNVTKSCVVDTTGICWPASSSTPSTTPSTTTEAPCTCPGGYEDGEFVPYPDSCYKFYMCYNGELIQNSCGEGNYFDNVSKSCVVDTTGICWPVSSSTPSTTPSTTTEAPCTCPGGYEDGEFVPYPDSCYKYYVCYNGELIENSCGEGNYFDNVTKSCVADTTGICWPVSSSTPSTTPSTTTEAPCTCPGGYEDGEFVPYPDSCYKYYLCYNGELIENNCGEGNYFDSDSKSCILDTTGICWPISSSTPSTTLSTSTEAPCTCNGGYDNGEFVPYPDSCYKYYICYNGELIENNCGEGNYFDPDSKSCILDTTGICWPISSSTPSTTLSTSTEAPCTCNGGYDNGEFVPYPDSCYKYYICYNGELIENNCGEGNYFDSDSKSCILDTTGICWPISSSTPSTTPSTTLSDTTEASCTCPGGYEDGEFVKHEGSCYMFYVCYLGELVEISCGFGNYFDNVTKSCVLDTSGVCWPTSTSTSTTQSTSTSSSTTSAPCKCEGGYEEGEFVAIPDSCSSFYICYQGELSQLSCGEGNYFDNTTNSCVSDTTGICWTKSTTSTTTNKPCTCPNGYQEGELIVNTAACYLYYVCTGGVLVEGDCGTGNYFNTETKACEPDTGGCCWPIPTPATCPNGMQEGQLSANTTACYLYNACHNGELVEGNCGIGNYFNTETKACEPDTEGSCWPISTPTKCPNGILGGQLSANPSACYMYNVCHNGVILEGNCGTGNYFNNETKACEPDTGGCCWPISTPTKCPNGMLEGQLSANPSACYLYNACHNGELVEGNCGTGNYFNSETNACEPDSGGCCWPITTPTKCPNGMQEGQLSDNPRACYLYNVCNNGELVEGNCGTGNYFNTETKACEPDTEGGCLAISTPTKCPNGMLGGQLSANPSACYMYNVCYNGVILEGNCGTGNYFNSETKACEPDTGGCCWPISTPTKCPNGMLEGQLSANPSACYLYNACHSGELVEGNCGTGNYFNTETKACEPDTEGSCWPISTPTKCPNGMLEGQLSANPSACYMYNVCHNGVILEGNCGTGNYFNSETKACEPDTGGCCWPISTPTKCPNGMLEGQLSANPSACYLYNACHNGELVEGNCGTGNYFNSETKACEPDTGGCCWPITTPTKCPNGMLEGQLSDNPRACYLYNVCINGELVEGNCGTGNYFNTETKSCEPDTEGGCLPISTPTKCPNGMLGGQLSANPSACYMYNVCYNGVILEGNCGTGNYFNSETKACEPDTGGCCWPISTPTKCPNGMLEGQLSANPSACYLYNACHNGELLEGNCGTGNYFNTETKACEPDTEGSCWPISTPTKCPNGMLGGQLSANPSACYMYNVCYNGVILEGNCGTGNYFNSETKACEPDTGGCCWPISTPTKCPNGMLEGQLSANPSACYLYNACHNGELVEGNCGAGNYFNSETKACEPDTGGCCWPITTPTKCPNGMQEGQLSDNPRACYLYNVCNNGELVEGNCGTGNYFNTETKACEPDAEGGCLAISTPTKCPNGMLGGQLSANPSACYMYNVCYNGVILEGNCGTGNYFNSETKACEPDTGGCCWPISTPTKCPNGMLEGQLSANPSACYLYNACHNGELLEGNCGTGNYFNTETKACEPDTEGSCWPITTPTKCSNGMLEGQLSANPTACYLYNVCHNGELVEGNCGAGNYFNSETTACEPDTGGCCRPITTPTKCSNGMLEGQLSANPTACYLYNVCHNGELVEGNCGAGNYFNSETTACEPDTGGCCWPITTQTKCSNGMLEGQLSANPTACYLYNVCHNGELVEGNCGAGNYFNSETTACEPDTGGCCRPITTPTKCSNGMLEGQLSANPTACYLYNVCHNGELVEGNCGTGNFFNSESNACEPDTGGCCWPKKTECPGGYANGDFVADPGQCDKFFICYDGVLVPQDCGVGYFFDVENNYCTRDINGTCWAVNAPSYTCQGAADGTFLPNEAACDKFFVCYNNEKIPQECGVGNKFSSVTLTCVLDTAGTCWKKVPNVCANTITGTFVVNPSNCQEFYVCHQNRAVLQQCGNGNWFNPELMVCQPDLEATCVNVCQGTSARTILPHPNCNQFYTCTNGLTSGVNTCPNGANFDATMGICSASATCEADLCSKSINGAIYPVQNDLASFYICFNRLPIKRFCPQGTSFDQDRLICTPDTGRCIGQKNGYAVPSYNNPNAYYVCRNNMAIFEQCPSYAVFDEKKRICVHAQRRRFVKNICSAERDGTVFPGDACNKFHLCLDGESIEQNCGAYSSFNQTLGHCELNLLCFDQDQICAKSSDIEKFPDARYENAFVQCIRGLAVLKECPENMVYSHDIGQCVHKDMAMTSHELDTLCENVPDNTLAPALDCRKFYICRKNTAMLQQCDIDQRFDITTGACLPDVERNCWMRSETLRGSFFLKTVCHEGQFHAHPTDCSQFEICTYGVWVAKACPNYNFFDAKINGCVHGEAEKICPTVWSVECLDEMPLRPSDTLCTDYYRCENNHWRLRQCPSGEYFNANLSTCTKDASACARNLRLSQPKDSLCTSNETRASSTDCRLFHICFEGEWWYSKCEEGHYFNKSLDTCIPNDGTCLLTSETGPCKNGTAMKSGFDPCVAYHLCVDGNWTLQYCPSSHHFDVTRKACMLDDGDEVCQNEIKNTSTVCVDGDRRPQLSNCTTFEICSYGSWLTVQCSAGFYFDLSLKLCISNRGECSADGLLRRDCTENTSRRNEKNCSEFYYCSKNKWQLESCMEGFQYNATIDKCILTNATCTVKSMFNWIRDKCVGSKSGSSMSHERDCTKYYLCVDNQAVEADCSHGRFYDSESKRCELNNGACPIKMLTDENICQGKSNGSHVQNPANCTTFYICTDTEVLLSLCPIGQYFNAEMDACQVDTGICNKPRLCDNNPGGHLPHETYCNIFYSCVRGIAIPVACEEDELFDPTIRKCISDIEKRCVDGILVDDHVCFNEENGKPLVDFDDCTKYIVCTNGQAQTLQCPQGQYFDNDLRLCIPDDGSCLFVDGPDLPNNSSIPPDPITCIGKHGYLMPDPVHCNEFYVCIYGNLEHDRCFDGEYFDINTYSCSPILGDDKCPTAGEMSTLCVNSEDETNFADQIDCRKYYECYDGELQSKKCRNGESFDTLLGFCRQNDGTCLLENGQRVGACAGKHGKLTADTENCRGYFTCINGQKITEECDSGEYFNKTTKMCQKDVNNACRPVEDEFTNTAQLSCVGLTELVFYPNTVDDCRTFFQCVKGMPRVHKCPDDLIFDGETGICDWKDYVKCIDMTEHYQSNEMCTDENNNMRYGNIKDNCDSYFICTDGKMSSYRCEQGLKYNAQLEKCDLAANVNCTMTA